MERVGNTELLEHSPHWLPGAVIDKPSNWARYAKNNEHIGGKRIENHQMTRPQTQGAVKSGLEEHPCAILVFEINEVRSLEAPAVRQRTDNAPGAMQDISAVDCLYLNPITETYALVDRRAIEPGTSSKTAVEHVADMLVYAAQLNALLFSSVLMDNWYATRNLMLLIEGLGKAYWCRIKDNRLAADGGIEEAYQMVSAIEFNSNALAHGKVVKLKGFPKDHRVRLFRVTADNGDAEYMVTDQLTQDATGAAQLMFGLLEKRNASIDPHKVIDMLTKRNAIETEESMHPARSETDTVNVPGMTEQPTVTISEHKGVRYLHLGTEWVQGAMNISKPDAIELEYVQQMMMWTLFNHQPQHIVQLGLGTGALTKFCYRAFPDAQVTTIELNPAVIAICESMFALPPNDARLNVIEIDAMDFVTDQRNHGVIDVLQVDLYDADARGPVLDSPEFYQACADCLTSEGMMTTNLFGDFLNYGKNLQAMELVFDAVVWLPEVHDANIVVIAFKRAPELEFSALHERASVIRRKMNLPAKSWVNGLKVWMLDK